MFGMVIKGQKLKTYSRELKLKAINLKLEGMTKRQISEELGIEHHDRVKVWMRNYKQFGKYGLMNNRGRRDSYKDEDMHLQKLSRENEMLKKALFTMSAITEASILLLLEHDIRLKSMT